MEHIHIIAIFYLSGMAVSSTGETAIDIDMQFFAFNHKSVRLQKRCNFLALPSTGLGSVKQLDKLMMQWT